MMAKPNYSYEKRQRELAKKKKQEEKRLRHARPKTAADEAAQGDAPAEPAAGLPESESDGAPGPTGSQS